MFYVRYVCCDIRLCYAILVLYTCCLDRLYILMLFYLLRDIGVLWKVYWCGFQKNVVVLDLSFRALGLRNLEMVLRKMFWFGVEFSTRWTWRIMRMKSRFRTWMRLGLWLGLRWNLVDLENWAWVVDWRVDLGGFGIWKCRWHAC